ncbi:MAG TPA: endolytic transglycosylase MltG [Lysobacter sp.]
MFVLIVLGAAAFWAWQHFGRFADAPLSGVDAGETLVVARGDSLPSVVRKLRELGIDDGEAYEWRALAEQLGAAGRLQVGEYALEPGITPRELLSAMRDGRVLQRRVTIVEGWNIRELRAALARATPLRQETAKLSDAELMAKLGKPGQHPEGRFLPETYLYTTGDSDLDVLRRAHAGMEKALAAAWERRHPGSVLKTPDEMLTLASIVEKETGVAEERPQIAGLFERRLRIGMRLQTDPTVIYGMGSAYDGNIRRRDLDTDTPYNTYTRAGLPPTPIAMPGVDALEAVARPADGDALYFVAVGDGSGRHLFARTYAEHQANVAKYLRNYRAARQQAAQ